MNRIGTLKEKSLHDSIKALYTTPRSKQEVAVDGYIIDVVRDKQLVEVQTKSFGSIRKKLQILTSKHHVRLVYPLVVEKTITTYNKSGSKVLSERKSPKKGVLLDIVSELLYIPSVVRKKKFRLDVVMVATNQQRIKDGKGSWRRNRTSIGDHVLIDVLDTVTFNCPKDYIRFLPSPVPDTITTKILRTEYGYKAKHASQLLYFLKHINVISLVGKDKNLHVYALK